MSRNLGDLLAAAAFFGALAKKIERGGEDGLEKAAVIVETKAKEAIGTYEFGWPSLAPSTIDRKSTGDSPLLETGALRASITHSVEGQKAFVGSNSDVAVYQDKGTSRIPPRPIFAPAAIATGPEIEAAVGETIIKKL